jgi:hypothetical protein
LRAALAKRDPHHIRSGSCCRIQPGRAEHAQTREIYSKIQSHNAAYADQQSP